MSDDAELKPANALKRRYEAELEAAARAGGRSRHGASTFRAMLKASSKLPARDLAFGDAKAWLWSDLHFGHDNIIRYANRPFADARAMDAALYANWAEVVGESDALLFLGDVAMRDAVGEETWRRIRAAPGAAKILVFGNHDLTGSGALRVDGFDDVCSVACVAGEPPLLLTHVPLADVPPGCVNVHGHTHDEAPGRMPHVNVSVEQIDYRPIALTDVRRLAAELVAGRVPEGATTRERVARIERTEAVQPAGQIGGAT